MLKHVECWMGTLPCTCRRQIKCRRVCLSWCCPRYHQSHSHMHLHGGQIGLGSIKRPLDLMHKKLGRTHTALSARSAFSGIRLMSPRNILKHAHQTRKPFSMHLLEKKVNTATQLPQTTKEIKYCLGVVQIIFQLCIRHIKKMDFRFADCMKKLVMIKNGGLWRQNQHSKHTC